MIAEQYQRGSEYDNSRVLPLFRDLYWHKPFLAKSGSIAQSTVGSLFLQT